MSGYDGLALNRHACLLLCYLVTLCLGLAVVSSAGELGLDVQAQPGLEPVAERLRLLDPRRLEPALQLTGLERVDPPVRVLVAAEGSQAARRAPHWASGYAYSQHGVVVLLPSRVKAYPYRSLELLLQHEVAHVLMARAARGRPLPRWFEEGVAMAAARDWGLEDRTRVWLGVLAGGRVPLADLEPFFHQGSSNAALAYAVSGAFVRDLLERHGPYTTADILALVARGSSFEQAFATAAGVSLERAEAAFWRRRLFWDRWVPVLTSSVTLWTGISLLALYAIRRRRQKDAAIRARWEQEERAFDPDSWSGTDRGGDTSRDETVH
jgi:hypothetical protein